MAARVMGRTWSDVDGAGSVDRVAIHGGWIVRTTHGGCFVPDVAHDWDVGNLQSNGVLMSQRDQRTLRNFVANNTVDKRIPVWGGWVCSVSAEGCVFVPDPDHAWSVGEEQASTGFYEGKKSGRKWEYITSDNTVRRVAVYNGWLVACVTQEGVFFVSDPHHLWIVGAENMG